MSKQFAICCVFVALLLAYAALVISRTWRKGGVRETFVEKKLDENLFIINTFEEVHGRKITTDELKHFSDMFDDSTLTKKEKRDKIEQFTEKSEQSEGGDAKHDNGGIASELSEIADRIKALSAKVGVKKPTASSSPKEKAVGGGEAAEKKTVEAFTPFSVSNKFVL